MLCRVKMCKRWNSGDFTAPLSLRYSSGKTTPLVQGQLWPPAGHRTISALSGRRRNTQLWVTLCRSIITEKKNHQAFFIHSFCFCFFHSWQIFKEVPTTKEPYWSDLVIGFRAMTDRELKRFPDHKFGQAFTTVKCECSSYLPWLEERFVLLYVMDLKGIFRSTFYTLLYIDLGFYCC